MSRVAKKALNSVFPEEQGEKEAEKLLWRVSFWTGEAERRRRGWIHTGTLTEVGLLFREEGTRGDR